LEEENHLIPFFLKRYRYDLVWISLLCASSLYAQNVDAMLDQYTHDNTLSQRTVDANKGHLVLFTREELERMHAKTLKDVFKTTPAIYYNENRYAFPDPLASGGVQPYKSNFIRLYIDGVEITQGWAGSGILLYGDVNIDFVDHIEFYYMAPSFESSVESAFLTIYLYSKDPKRDGGAKVNLIGGSRGYTMQTFGYGEQRDDLSYMVNISRTDAKRAKIDNGTAEPLSRDFKRLQLFSYVKSEDQIFHLQVMRKNMDSLAGGSWDATPLVSQMNFTNLHMDYGIDLTDVWHVSLSYDWLKITMKEEDELPLIWQFPVSNRLYTTTRNTTFTGELVYKKIIGDHRINAGIKTRDKELDSIILDGVTVPLPSFNSEKLFSMFFQDQYTLSQKQLLSLGISYNFIDRNGGVTDDNLLQLRLGYIYANEQWSYKAYLYRMQIALEPLMRGFYPEMTYDLKAQTTWGVTQEIGYTVEKQHARLMLAAVKDEDSLFRSVDSQSSEDGKYILGIFDYDYRFDEANKLKIQLHYAKYDNVYGMNGRNMGGYASLFNTYERFDFYNGVVWHRNSIEKVNYIDWTSSITWNISGDLTLTLKGENLLDKGVKSNLYRFDITTMPPTMETPLKIPQFDRRVTVELEYLF